MKKSVAAAFAFALALLFSERTASAQLYQGPQLMPQVQTPKQVDQTTLGDSGKGEKAKSTRSVKLFDSDNSQFSWQLDIGPLWNRRVQDTDPVIDRTNFKHGAPLAGEIGIGTLYTTTQGPFYLVGHQKTLFRILDDKSFSWALFHQELGGGIRLGPLEPEARLRLGIMSADIIHAQFSAQLLSPGVAAGLGLRLGQFRVDVQGSVDYLWRWFGPDYVVRSLTLGLRFDQPKVDPFTRTQ
jgi:hypothetical protein